jgi:hypothetical protein
MDPPKKILLTLLQDLKDDAPLGDVQKVIARADQLMGAERLYYGWKRSLVTVLGAIAVPLAIASVFAVRYSKECGVYVYMFWAIAPPSWFFIEWVWLFTDQSTKCLACAFSDP